MTLCDMYDTYNMCDVGFIDKMVKTPIRSTRNFLFENAVNRTTLFFFKYQILLLKFMKFKNAGLKSWCVMFIIF